MYIVNFYTNNKILGNSRTNLWKKRKAQKQLQHKAKQMRNLDEIWDIKAQDKGKAPAISALSYCEDILAQSKRQMQRIEECYNELKNQLRSLQNAKNELAKLQSYKVQKLTFIFYYFRLLLDEEKKIYMSEKIADTLWKDIRNTEYMSRCIRGWSKDFLEQGILPRYQQEKHVKRESLLNDKDLKLAACIWLHSIPPKDCSPLALKKELETNIFPKLLGVPIIISESTTRKFMYLWGFHKKTIGQQVYFNGHEREDVREYRKKWAMRMINYQKKMEQYDSDEMENVIPPERLEIWDTHHVLVTHDEVYFYANDDNSFVWVEDKESIIKKKGQGSAIMASNFLCPCHGPLCLTEANTIQLGLD
ncbi:43412_t:CDS:2 [Gigaspora margarita]|uniref:43412_t:CDS:1 n=1 Tax=Gigaspora margarita TaxID=4874 RepID=A0ABN7VJQ5_GIGMA|nr:43412_t:CDS:2 [Gigaspora margarita]